MTPNSSEQGFRLLKHIRSYLELDMYMSLTMHTEETLAFAEKEQLVWEENLEVNFYIFNIALLIKKLRIMKKKIGNFQKHIPIVMAYLIFAKKV